MRAEAVLLPHDGIRLGQFLFQSQAGLRPGQAQDTLAAAIVCRPSAIRFPV